MHRIVSEDDRRVMASSMNIKNEEADIVATLSVGEAVVYSDGDDGAYNIQVPYAKLDVITELDEDLLIQEKMSTYLGDDHYISPYLSCPVFCSKVCLYKDVGEEIREDYRIRNAYHPLVLSLVENIGYEDFLIQMFETGNDQARISGNPIGVKICAAIQGAENFFGYLGSKYHWTYDEQSKVLSNFLDLYVDTLSNYIKKRRLELDEGKINSFSKTFLSLVHGKQPESFCGNICDDGTCRYRYSLQKSLDDEFYHNIFVETINEGGSDMWEILYKHCFNVASTLVAGLTDEALNKIALCYALQKCYTLESFEKRHVDQVMSNLYELINTHEVSFP
jgi:hypothetical protein